MRYKDLNDLPDVLKHLLPNREAQEIYLKVYNETWDSFQGDEPEQRSREIEAHRDGWAAVEREFVHDEERGIWYRWGEKLEEQAKPESFIDKIKHFVM